MTKEELFKVADEMLTRPYDKEEVLRFANYLMENGRQMMLNNAELQREVAILNEREACAKMCDYVYDNIVTDEHIKDMAFKIRARGEA